MIEPKLLRCRGRIVICATAIRLADGRFRPNAEIQTKRLDSTVNERVPFEGPLFDSYFDAAQYALEMANELHVQLQRVRHASEASAVGEVHGQDARGLRALAEG